MGTETWNTLTGDLAETFPLTSDSSKSFPELAIALDDGVEDLLQNSLAESGNGVNPLYVEDLLNDCMTRIGNCLTIREKAQDIEVKAINDATLFKLQETSLALQKKSFELLSPSYDKLVVNAVGFKSNSDRSEYYSLGSAVWSDIATAQKTVNDALELSLNIKKIKAEQKGNGSNYAERFIFLKALFDLNIVEAYRRCRVCEFALDKIYGIKEPLPLPIDHGYLNLLTIWAQKVSDRLDLELDSRSIGNAIFAVASEDENTAELWLTKRSVYDASLDTKRVGFTLTSSHFERLGMKDVLLRSVRLQARCPDDNLKTRIWQSLIHLPDSAVSRSIQKFSATMTTGYQDIADSEAVVRGVHNISPIGEWAIDLSSKALTGENTDKGVLKNIFLILRVSYRSL